MTTALSSPCVCLCVRVYYSIVISLVRVCVCITNKFDISRRPSARLCCRPAQSPPPAVEPLGRLDINIQLCQMPIKCRPAKPHWTTTGLTEAWRAAGLLWPLLPWSALVCLLSLALAIYHGNRPTRAPSSSFDLTISFCCNQRITHTYTHSHIH